VWSEDFGYLMLIMKFKCGKVMEDFVCEVEFFYVVWV